MVERKKCECPVPFVDNARAKAGKSGCILAELGFLQVGLEKPTTISDKTGTEGGVPVVVVTNSSQSVRSSLNLVKIGVGVDVNI